MDKDYAPTQNQNTDFKIAAWYKAGGTVFSTTQGHLNVTSNFISFIDETGNNVFTFSLNDIQKVRLDPSQFFLTLHLATIW